LFEEGQGVLVVLPFSVKGGLGVLGGGICGGEVVL
jgi:hypothetical protein